MSLRSKKKLKVFIAACVVMAISSVLVLIFLLQNHESRPAPPSNAPSTTKPTDAQIQEHSVLPATPRYLVIDKYNIKARVMPLGLDKDNRIESPDNVYDVGWYKGSKLPGQPGAMLIDGHVSSWTTKGVFYRLKDLKKDDTIKLERGDGKIFTYKVVDTRMYEAKKVDMVAAQMPIDNSAPGLNLITCAGKVIENTNDFTHRTIVFTKQVE